MELNKPDFSKVKLMVMDVDGILTDGAMWYSESGDEFKRFSFLDGMGIGLATEAGVTFAIITRERTNIVQKRADKLKIAECHQGVWDKLPTLQEIAGRLNFSTAQILYIGDDVNDLDCLNYAGIAVTVPHALPRVKAVCDYVTQHEGGNGAVREVCELILESLNV